MDKNVAIQVKTNLDVLLEKAERLKRILEEAKAIEEEIASSKIAIELLEVEA